MVFTGVLDQIKVVKGISKIRFCAIIWIVLPLVGQKGYTSSVLAAPSIHSSSRNTMDDILFRCVEKLLYAEDLTFRNAPAVIAKCTQNSIVCRKMKVGENIAMTSLCGEIAWTYSANAPRDQKHLWTIEQDPVFSINLTFNKFEWYYSDACYMGYLSVYNVSAIYPDIAERYCGYRAPWSLYSSSNVVSIIAVTSHLVGNNRVKLNMSYWVISRDYVKSIYAQQEPNWFLNVFKLGRVYEHFWRIDVLRDAAIDVKLNVSNKAEYKPGSITLYDGPLQDDAADSFLIQTFDGNESASHIFTYLKTKSSMCLIVLSLPLPVTDGSIIVDFESSDDIPICDSGRYHMGAEHGFADRKRRFKISVSEPVCHVHLSTKPNNFIQLHIKDTEETAPKSDDCLFQGFVIYNDNNTFNPICGFRLRLLRWSEVEEEQDLIYSSKGTQISLVFHNYLYKRYRYSVEVEFKSTSCQGELVTCQAQTTTKIIVDSGCRLVQILPMLSLHGTCKLNVTRDRGGIIRFKFFVVSSSMSSFKYDYSPTGDYERTRVKDHVKLVSAPMFKEEFDSDDQAGRGDHMAVLRTYQVAGASLEAQISSTRPYPHTYLRIYTRSSRCLENTIQPSQKIPSLTSFCGRFHVTAGSGMYTITIKRKIGEYIWGHVMTYFSPLMPCEWICRASLVIIDELFKLGATFDAQMNDVGWKTLGSEVTLMLVIPICHYGFCKREIKYEAKRYENMPKQLDSDPDSCVIDDTKMRGRYYKTGYKRDITWVQARAECKKWGGDLVSFANKQELILLKKASVMGSCRKPLEWLWKSGVIYIGYRKINGRHKWVDGTNGWFTEWNVPGFRSSEDDPRTVRTVNGNSQTDRIRNGFLKSSLGWYQPHNTMENSCVAMLLSSPHHSTKWISVPCDVKYQEAAYMCEKDRKIPQTTPPPTSPPITTDSDVANSTMPDLSQSTLATTTPVPIWPLPTSSHICPGDWVLLGSRCYMLLTSSTLMRPTAQKFQLCQEHGGSLAWEGLSDADIIKLLIQWDHQPSSGGIWLTVDIRRRSWWAVSCYGSVLVPEKEVFDGEYNWKRFSGVPCSLPKYGNYPMRNVLCSTTAQPVTNEFFECLPQHFQCEDGHCILGSLVCDGHVQCPDASDELDCSANCTASQMFSDLRHLQRIQCPKQCGWSYFRCFSDHTHCIPWTKVCDSVNDCKDHSDEVLCPSDASCQRRCSTGECVPDDKICDGQRFCPRDDEDEWSCNYCVSQNCHSDNCLSIRSRFRCTTKDPIRGNKLDCAVVGPQFAPCSTAVRYGCYPRSRVCIYDVFQNEPMYCNRGQHLQNCQHFECPGMFKCQKSYCINMRRVCDGVFDCEAGDDEKVCDKPFCKGGLWCEDKCIGKLEICDGTKHCEKGEDELMCGMICPTSCRCLGPNVLCDHHKFKHLPKLSDNTKILIVRHGSLTNITRLIYTYSSLVVVDFSHNYISKITPFTFHRLARARVMVLSHNRLASIETSTFVGLGLLDKLDVSHNPIKQIEIWGFEGMFSLPRLDLSRLGLHYINNYAFLTDVSLTHLDLSYNHITYLNAHVFAGMQSIVSIDLRHNNLELIDPVVFTTIMTLRVLHTDEYKFCCAATHVDQCTPKGDVYSSCADLMASKGLRAGIWILAIFALIGNLSVIIYRGKMESKTPLSFLVQNLGLADFMMGLYLLIIASADAYYRDVYYLYDYSWRMSVMCRLAGFCSMLSSEMSVFVLILITSDRIFVIALGRRGFNGITVRIVVAIGWVLFTVLSILPIANLSYFGNDDYIQHGVCFLFNLTEGKVSGWEYSTFIFIGFNLFALIYLAVGYSYIFYIILRRTGLKGGPEVAVARKMALVVLTDCFCWIPPIIIGIMSLQDVPINPQAAMWIAVFVFPINSSLNPFLYTFGALQNKEAEEDDNEDGDSMEGSDHDDNDSATPSNNGVPEHHRIAIVDPTSFEVLEGACGGVDDLAEKADDLGEGAYGGVYNSTAEKVFDSCKQQSDSGYLQTSDAEDDVVCMRANSEKKHRHRKSINFLDSDSGEMNTLHIQADVTVAVAVQMEARTPSPSTVLTPIILDASTLDAFQRQPDVFHMQTAPGDSIAMPDPIETDFVGKGEDTLTTGL